MSGNEHRAGFGRFAAPAGLAVSAALFVTSLSGIASIDPGAQAATSAAPQVPSVHDVSLDGKRERGDRRDCPFRDADKPHRDITS